MANLGNFGSDFSGQESLHHRRVFESMRLRRLVPFIFLVFAAMTTLLVVACGGQTFTSGGNSQNSTTQHVMPAITIKAMDFSFDQPNSIPAGLVDITFENNGGQPHQIQLARINNGNFDELSAALKKGPEAALPLVTLTGGANTIDPGAKQEVILNLQQGTYASICFVSGQDNVPHYMKGMLSKLIVTESSGNQIPAPKDNGQIVLQDFSFTMPSSIPSGPVTLKVTNNGPQGHELDLVKPVQGKGAADVLNYLNAAHPSGPPPFTDAGGMGALQTGSSAWVKLNLQPGNYVAVCFVPDVKTGKPHFMLGMHTAFTVK